MRYFAQYENNKLIAIGKGPGGTEITKEEYEILKSEIKEKAALVDQLYSGEITIEDVKTEWQEEIQRRVAERVAQDEAMAEKEISSEEFYDMVEEVL